MTFEPAVLGVLPASTSLQRTAGLDDGRVYTVRFSPNGRRWAAQLEASRSKMIGVVDGKEVIRAHGVTAPVFSANSEHVVFTCHSAKRGQLEFAVILNGERIDEKAACVGRANVTNDGQPIYWRSVSDGPVKEGTEGDPEVPVKLHFGSARSEVTVRGAAETDVPPVLLQDGKLVGTVLATPQGQRVMCMDRAGGVSFYPEANGPWMSDWSFSKSMKRFAQAAATSSPKVSVEGQQPRVRIDGRPVPSGFEASGVPVVGDRGKLVAYKVLLHGKMGVATDKSNRFDAEWAFVSRPVIGPKEKTVAYAGYTEATGYPLEFRMYGDADRSWRLRGACRLVIRTNRKPPKALDEEFQRIKGIVFSPNGKEIAYAGLREEGWFVHWEDRILGPYASVDRLAFDRTGKKLAFGVVQGREVRWEVVQ